MYIRILIILVIFFRLVIFECLLDIRSGVEMGVSDEWNFMFYFYVFVVSGDSSGFEFFGFYVFLCRVGFKVLLSS